MKLLYHTGLFGQVQVLARPGREGVEIVFRLFPRQRVRKVNLVGCQELPEEKLQRLVRLQRGDEFDEWRMQVAARDMLELYRRHGWRQARIVARAEPVGKNDFDVNYYISEGAPTRISRIWFKGHGVFPQARLRREMELSAGDVADVEKLQASCQRLLQFYRQQGYLEAVVEAEPIDAQADAHWVVVAIRLNAGPRLHFRFSGNRIFSDAALRQQLNLEEASEHLEVERLAGRLVSFYRHHGYARAHVDWRVKLKKGRHRKEVHFFISEGRRVRVRAIDFVGNTAFGDEVLRNYIYNALLGAIDQNLAGQALDRGDLDPLGGGYPWRGKSRRPKRDEGLFLELVPARVYLQAAYRQALEEIADLYRSHGYLRVQVGPQLLSYDDSGANLYISIPVREGVQTRIESISFAGNQAVAAATLLETIESDGRVSPGKALDLYGVERLRRRLLDAYQQRGYLYCQVKNKLLFSRDNSLAEVTFEIEEGPQVRVGRVLVRGNVDTRDTVFAHLVTFQHGDVYSPARARQIRHALDGLGIFTGADIKLIDPEVMAREKDLLVEVRERLTQSLTFSPGISTAEGVRLQIDYTHRNLLGYALEFVGRAKVNYLAFYPLYPQWEDRYQRMSFWEGLEGYLLAGLHWPRVWFSSEDLAARIDLLGLQDHAISHDLAKFSLTPGLDWTFEHNLSLTAETELEFDRLGCLGGECGGPTHKYLRYDEGSLLLACLRPKFSWDLRDDFFRPHRGLLLMLMSELAGNLLTDREVLYLKLDGTISGYLPLSRRVTLALSVRSGFIFNLTSDSRTPSHKLFWLGGRNSVRGFSEEGLIPADQSNPEDPGNPCVLVEEEGEEKCVSMGGTALLLLKAELRFPLVADILDGAIFIDLGNLWMRPENFRPYDLRPAAGLGVRVNTPVGPLAFDVGFNLAPDAARREESWNLHFNIGVF
ncbi:MAG: hypothetical protein DRI34_14335 [Deltaproteobacteria bacterium]|nr:MAG: hypothetical protein DRI34_14335 [Deltaproteobacteria bacterium]